MLIKSLGKKVACDDV